MFRDLLCRLADELSNQNVPYMIIGGQAVLLYGEPRLTKDIDIALGMGIDGLERIENVATALALKALVDDIGQFVIETMVYPVLEEKSGIRVDFIFSFSPYEKQAIKRAKNIDMGKSKVRFAALEDVLIHKIFAGRARDMEDAKSILLKNPDHDEQYILKWLEEFDRSLDEGFVNKFRNLAQSIKDET
ncbi:nucleotidyl transferase AbiEii/AbiGii toxin family protein [Acidobacteriota bacterium]